MFSLIDNRFEKIVNIITQNGGTQKLITKAYNTAKYLHKNQIRKDGKPYLSHPVEVAYILAKLGFDEDVISAALLHDVVEDCGYTIEELTNNFNKNVAELVDCVSAIDKEKFVFDEDDIFEDKNFEKASIEEQSFKKLVNIGKKNPLGFCIKFADRLHNLRTIECFDYNKQLEKVKETEKWIIPIAKILHTEYFYRELKNECFKIVNKYNGAEFLEQYDNYHQLNKHNLDIINTQLKEIFSNSSIKEIKISPVKEYKTFNNLCKIMKLINISKISQGQILKVANNDIYLIYDNLTYEQALKEFWQNFNEKSPNLFKVIDAKIGQFNRYPYFLIEDKYKNKYNLVVISQNEYISNLVGTLDGQIKDIIEDYNIDNLSQELIKIKTRSGEIKYMPKGSTALDFAFKIHKSIGFGFKYAIINNSKTKSPPYTKLYDGDKIEIIIDKDDNGDIVPNVEIRWLAYVSTDLAKKVLIRYFEKLLK